MPYFSVLIPSWNRKSILAVAINSVFAQTYNDWELLIMDDGSDDGTWEYLQNISDPRVRCFRHETPQERMISRSELMNVATGDWIFWLDSDDSIVPVTLEILKHNIEKYPDYKVFNFGQIILSLTGTTVKLAQDLPERDGEGMGHFDSGLVGTGGFVFARECLTNITPLPKVNNPFDLANWFGKEVDKWFDENSPGTPHQLYGTEDEKDENSNIIRECRWCGNPVGDDYVFMWLLTRKYKSKKLPLNLLVSLIRTESWLYEFADVSGVLRGPSSRKKRT